MKKLRICGWICALSVFLATFAGCSSGSDTTSSDAGASSEAGVTSSLTESEITSSEEADATASTASTTATSSSKTTGDTTGKTSSTGKTPSQATTNNQTPGKPTEQIDYKDVKAEMYLASASPSMTGTLTVDTSKVVNASIVGGGINFAFSDYNYFDYIGGDGFAQTMPFYFELEELENERWEEFEKQLKFTGTQYVRLQVNYTQWEPINDNNSATSTDFKKGFIFSPDFKSRADAANVPDHTYKMMEQMYRVLDIFEEMGCYVILGSWDSHSANQYCPEAKNWLHDGEPTSRTKLHVKSMEEHGETFAAIMYHLIVEKGYKCVKGFSIYNEPENFDDYVGELTAAYTKCDEHLKRLGIRDKVIIQGFDGGVTWTKNYGHSTTGAEKVLENCPQGVDTVSQHLYVKNITELAPVVQKMVAVSKGRPTFGGEVGIQTYEKEGATFKVPLFNAMLVSEAFNNGLKGYGIWDYNTCYPNTNKEDYWNLIVADPDVSFGLTTSPINFYPSSLIIKYFPAGTNIVSNTLEGCAVNKEQQVYATVGTKNGQTTILLVNQSEQAAAVTINGIDKSKKYQCHYVTEEKTDRIYPGDTYDMKLVKKVCLRPRSITVLTTYTYGTQTVR